MSLFTVFSTVNDIVDFVKDPGESIKGEINNIKDNLKNSRDLLEFDGNICKFVNSLSVEPVIVTTELAQRSPIYYNVLETMVSVFTSYYLQAFRILTDIYGKNVRLSIGLLNNRNSRMLSRLSYFDDLLDLSQECLISKEANKTNIQFKGNIDKTYDKIGNRFIEVEVRVDNNKNGVTIKVPITVRPVVIESTISNIVALISPEDYNKSFMHRWREWRSGGISLMDFIFSGDLVKEYRKNKLKDKDDLLNITTQYNVDAIKSIPLKGGLKFSRHYNMFLMGHEDVRAINNVVKGDIYKPAFRERFLDAGNAIINTVLNDDYERATMMICDLYADTIVPYNRLKDSSKNPDYSQLMQLLLQNKTLQF